MTNLLLKTPLYDSHLASDGRMVDFGGWLLPTQYTSQIEEHNAVRNSAGMFDVSHMTVSDVTGAGTVDFLSKLLANDIQKIASTAGKAMYSCMLNTTGGVIDDLIVYYLNDEHCRLVTNAATNQKDMAWLTKQVSDFSNVTIKEQPQLALVAVQGPDAIRILQQTFPGSIAETIGSLKRFQGNFSNCDNDVFIGRTGYTGEDGVEIILPDTLVDSFWNALIKAGVAPCGLGARDTLRLEAGMALYGSDLSEEYTPLESGLAWTVSMNDERDFIGKKALQRESRYKMIGLELESKGVLRAHQKIQLNGEEIGEITSGTYSPTLSQSIALARVKSDAKVAISETIQVSIRQKLLDVRVVTYPFLSK